MSSYFTPPLYRGVCAARYEAYRIAYTEYHAALDSNQGDEAVGVVSDKHSRALDLFMLTPAETTTDIRRKLEVFDAEEIDQEWWSCRHIVAMMAVDARCLLPLSTKGGAK